VKTTGTFVKDTIFEELLFPIPVARFVVIFNKAIELISNLAHPRRPNLDEIPQKGAKQFMRLSLRILAFAALAASLLCAGAVHAQKVKYNFDKSVNFEHYKHYAWAKNYLITRQMPDDQKSIADSIKSSINRQLNAKGFTLDEKNPDFLISYEAGGMTKSDLSNVPDLSRNIADPNAIDQPAFGLPMTATDAWVSVLAGIRVTIQDAGTKKPIWIGQLSTKVKDPQNVMLTVDKQVDAAMAKLLQPFPPQGPK